MGGTGVAHLAQTAGTGGADAGMYFSPLGVSRRMPGLEQRDGLLEHLPQGGERFVHESAECLILSYLEAALNKNVAGVDSLVQEEERTPRAAESS